jgi:hypothetical protein
MSDDLSQKLSALAYRVQEIYTTVYGHTDKEGQWHDGMLQLSLDNRKEQKQNKWILVGIASLSIANTFHIGTIQGIFQVLSKVMGL